MAARGDDRKGGGSGIGKVLGSISPLYGALSGRGLFGNAMAGLHDATGMGGILPILASEQRKKRRERREGEAPEPGEGMKRGGKAKAKTKKYAKGGSTASKRADGCAVKGKTKGRFV